MRNATTILISSNQIQSSQVQSSQVQSIDRVGDILRCFSLREPVLSLAQIVKQVGLAKSTVHRLIGAMIHNGLLRPVGTAQYALGYSMLHWASIAQAALEVRSQAQPFLVALAAETSETVVLMTRDGNFAVCIDKIDSPQPLRIAISVGERIWLHAGSSAKILMAYLTPAEIAAVIGDQGLPAMLPNTITDSQALQAELAQIRQQGYAVSSEERDRGAAGIAAPIFDNAHQVIAGVGIIGPVFRVMGEQQAQQIERVVTTAARISQAMGAPVQFVYPSVLNNSEERSL
jgi:DNA-binding IclR family transcriptional regulator